MKTVKTITIFSLLIFALYSFIVQNWVSAGELILEIVIIIISLILEEVKTRKNKKEQPN